MSQPQLYLRDLLPPLDDSEWQALKESIASEGLLVPVLLDEAGHILDGHHRRRPRLTPVPNGPIL